MISYHSNANFAAPPYQQTVARMRAEQTPFGGQNHRDVFGGLHQGRTLDMARYAQQQADEYNSAAQRAQRELALSGLNMMAQAQQQQQGLQTGRLQMLLGGLL
jgi:hypothetical protein